MLLIRRVGAACLAVAAVIVWFALTPSEKPAASANFSPQIATALDDYDTNNASAGYAPQQQVVNGWVTKDLLTVIAREQNAALSPQSAPRDERIPAELLLVVLGLALLAGTNPRPTPAPRTAAVNDPAPVPTTDGAGRPRTVAHPPSPEHVRSRPHLPMRRR